MKKFVVLSIVFSSLLAAVIGTTPAFAATTPANNAPTPSVECYVTHIHLNGKATPTSSCIQTKSQHLAAQQNQGIKPLSSVDNLCFLQDVTYYEDSNGNGRQLCVDGTGTLDLTTVWIVWPFQNWANRISSVRVMWSVTTRLYFNTSCSGSFDGPYGYSDGLNNVHSNDASRCIDIR